MVLVDNFDSFTFNVAQLLATLGAHIIVVRNDAVTVADVLERLRPTHIVISPGPGHPRSAGISMELIRAAAGLLPVLGVCLGMQAMYEVWCGDGSVAHAGEIVHGKAWPVMHDGRGLFAGLPSPLRVVRYHSLAGRRDALRLDEVEVTAASARATASPAGGPISPPPAGVTLPADTLATGVIQGIRHRKYTVEGVQVRDGWAAMRARPWPTITHTYLLPM